MIIEYLHMDSFMGKKDFSAEFSRGVNILRGDNESGKSTIAEFIKFMLYGAASKGSGGSISERQHYLPFGDASFGGWMQVRVGNGIFRIDRTVTAAANGFRESLTISDVTKRTQVFKGENAGDVLLGVPETVFAKTAYISQTGDAYTGGADLGEAIENLLFSADETVSTDKALKKLDGLRTSLLHKNGKGGILYDTRRERDELSERLDKALSDNSEIIACEGRLAETLRKIDEDKTEYSRCRKVCELYDTYLAYVRFKKLDEVNEKAKQLDEKEAEQQNLFDGFIPDGEYLGRLRQTVESVGTQDTNTAAARAKYECAVSARVSAEKNAQAADASPELAEGARNASAISRLSKTLSVIGGILAALGVLFAAANYLMKWDAMFYAVGGAVCALGIVLLVVGIVKKRGLATVLRSFGASDVFELEEKLRASRDIKESALEALNRAREEEAAEKALLEREEEQSAEKRSALEAEMRKICKAETEADELFAKIEEYISASESIKTQKKLCAEQCARLTAEQCAYDRENVEAVMAAAGDISVFEKIEIAEYSRKRDFCENAISALEIKKGDLEQKLAALRATVENPALLKSTLNALDKKIATSKAKYDAVDLAMRSIENASLGLRTRVSPRLAEYAGKLLSTMTDGRYTDVGVGSDLVLTYMSQGGAHSTEYMSKGTREAAYFALRLALFDLLYKTEKAPLILDECFAHTDDTRTAKMFRILAALAECDTQSIVLTCHEREEKIAEKVGFFNCIAL